MRQHPAGKRCRWGQASRSLLIVCIALAAAWGGSLFTPPLALGYRPGKGAIQLQDGLLGAILEEQLATPVSLPSSWPAILYHGTVYVAPRSLFGARTYGQTLPVIRLFPVSPTTRCWFVIIPLVWPLTLAAGLTAWLRVRERRRHRDPSACQTCGYNLTGNASGVCPECGMKVDLGETNSGTETTNQRHPSQLDRNYVAILLRLFPDLGLIADEEERNRIYGAALADARMWRIVLPVYGILITALLGVFLIAGWYPPSRDKFALGLGITLGLCALASLLVWRGHRRRMNRTVWRELAALGIRICGSCGYNLAGNASGVCPECGDRVVEAPGALVARHGSTLKKQ